MTAIGILYGASAVAPITLVAQASAGSTTSGDVTTIAIDTTGSSLIVITCAYLNGTGNVISDSAGNTWTFVADYLAVLVGCEVGMWYCYAPATSGAHTFSTVGMTFPSINVLALAGTTGSVIDTYTGTYSATANTQNTGSITPAANGSLLVAALSSYNYGPGFPGNNLTGATNGFFTTYYTAGGTGTAYTNSLFWQVQATAAAISTTITWQGGDTGAAMIASFH